MDEGQVKRCTGQCMGEGRGALVPSPGEPSSGSLRAISYLEVLRILFICFSEWRLHFITWLIKLLAISDQLNLQTLSPSWGLEDWVTSPNLVVLSWAFQRPALNLMLPRDCQVSVNSFLTQKPLLL